MDEVVYPTQREAILAAMVGARRDEGTVYVCRCNTGQGKCADCYQIGPNDRRSVDEHLAAYARRDA